MNLKDAMDGYDYELPLLDALNDPELSLSRRLLAGAAVGEGLDTAYFATTELLEAYVALEADVRSGQRHGDGYLALEEILRAANPMQMKAWCLLNELSIPQAVMDLAWLKGLTYQRATMSGVLREQRLPRYYTPARDLVEGPTAADWMAVATTSG